MNRIKNWRRTVARTFKGHVPGQVIIQITDRCNASCPQCGMHKEARFARATLADDDIKRIIDYAGKHSVQAMSFTGGEPLLMLDTLADLLRHAGSAGIRYLRTGTNGFFFRNPEAPDFLDRVKRVAHTLANTPLRNLWISLDSALPEVHEQMRGFSGIMRGIERALPIFHDAGIYPAANLGMSRMLHGNATLDLTPAQFSSRREYLEAFHDAFSTGLRTFYDNAIELGFTMSNVCYPMSIDRDSSSNGLEAVYEAAAENRIVAFDREEKGALFRALLDVVPEYRAKLRIFTPCASLYALRQYYEHGIKTQYPCRGGYDFFFISAQDGDTYPCGYRGTRNLGKFWGLRETLLDPEPLCTMCDWECFRDPSELIGPLSDLVRRPWRVTWYMLQDPVYPRLWLRDLRYFRACQYFDGRTAPDHRRMAAFMPSTGKMTSPSTLGSQAQAGLPVSNQNATLARKVYYKILIAFITLISELII